MASARGPQLAGGCARLGDQQRGNDLVGRDRCGRANARLGVAVEHLLPCPDDLLPGCPSTSALGAPNLAATTIDPNSARSVIGTLTTVVATTAAVGIDAMKPDLSSAAGSSSSSSSSVSGRATT
ncbi:MAG: hypothetical protein R2710_29090 [Acidimicrobiales bacterium]